MAKGWKEHRLEANGLWQYTGQLRDQPPFATSAVGVNARGGVDTAGLKIVVWSTASVVMVPPAGTLGWVQYVSAPEKLPVGLATSDFEPPARRD